MYTFLGVQLGAVHDLVEQGDLDGLTALLAEHGESLAPGERESMEQERERLATRALGSISEVPVLRYFIHLLSARSRLYRRRSLQVNT